MDPIRVAVVGVAGMGGAHCFAASTMPEYELVAVCDIAEGPREKSAASFGALAFADVEVLYASGLIDAVILATPPSTHVALVRDALDAGLHVYCEKPFVIDAADGYALGEAASAAGKIVQVGFQYRFQPSYAEVRSLIEAGDLGPIFRREPGGDQLVPAAGIFRGRALAQAVEPRGRRGADEPGDPPARRAAVVHRPAGAGDRGALHTPATTSRWKTT